MWKSFAASLNLFPTGSPKSVKLFFGGSVMRLGAKCFNPLYFFFFFFFFFGCGKIQFEQPIQLLVGRLSWAIGYLIR